MNTQSSEKKGTFTSSFGVSRRENHDSSLFYSRFNPPELSQDTNICQTKNLDQLFCKNARSMDEVENNSVALVVTSPPYYAGKEYESILDKSNSPSSYPTYLEMLEDVFAECVKKLEPGGRIAINVANLGRKPYRSLSSDITSILQDRLNLLLRGEVVWIKAKGAGGSCAWGSFQKPTNPVLRDVSERIIIASKGRFDRALSSKRRQEKGLPYKASIFRDEFMESTKDIWEFPPESAHKVNHPAPFPVALPKRLIHLYTYENDLILDPFIGSGTCAIAALETGRHFIGYDTEKQYISQARIRIKKELNRRQNNEVSHYAAEAVFPSELTCLKSVQEKKSARQIALEILYFCGFKDIYTNVVSTSGIELDFKAKDQKGNPWYFDVSGGFTSTNPGLNHPEVFWKTLGKATVASQNLPQVPLIVLTPSIPLRKKSFQKTLSLVTGAGKPIRDIIVITSQADLHKLKQYANANNQ